MFDQFWAAYPSRDGRKRGKGETFARWKLIDEADYPAIIEAAKHYAKDEQVKKGYAKDPVRFLKHDYWKDFVEPVASLCQFRSLTPCEQLAEPGQEVCAFHRAYRSQLAKARKEK